MNTDRFLTRQEVQALTKLSRSTIYRLMRAGEFPEPIRIARRSVRWHVSEIENYLAQQPRAKGNG